MQSAGMQLLGIDIGGSGIKGAPVNIEAGNLVAERLRLATPSPSTPDAVAGVIRQITESFGTTGGPLGAVTSMTTRSASSQGLPRGS